MTPSLIKAVHIAAGREVATCCGMEYGRSWCAHADAVAANPEKPDRAIASTANRARRTTVEIDVGRG